MIYLLVLFLFLEDWFSLTERLPHGSLVRRGKFAHVLFYPTCPEVGLFSFVERVPMFLQLNPIKLKDSEFCHFFNVRVIAFIFKMI